MYFGFFSQFLLKLATSSSLQPPVSTKVHTNHSSNPIRIRFSCPHRPKPKPRLPTTVLTSSQICSMLFREAGSGFYRCTTCDKQYMKVYWLHKPSESPAAQSRQLRARGRGGARSQTHSAYHAHQGPVPMDCLGRLRPTPAVDDKTHMGARERHEALV
ncbi:hypothetical protein PF008_g1070 [Phytophthora fragariae]|uniref:Ig-like domain-containing protein n=1 Tax=Phytophthora fragariae TaxID=53985 RepID=A0A6G0SL27_9STRA|nr:hypothetical protein PF008_g1070 [Phytophthora fragariae]